MRVLRVFVIFAVLVGVVLKALQSLGVIGSGECSPGCECSQGQMDCTCGHRTCLAPAVT
ncbi:MAG: hypothetical protein WD058_00925 [Dehalococcoidia bacterium]